MIDVAVQFLKEELNGFLRARMGNNLAEIVKLSKVVDDTGKYAFDAGTIAASIINIEEDRIFKSQLPDYTYVNGQHVVLEPELKLNLHLLFAANFNNYDQALKFISYLLLYFQAHSSFTSEEYPALDPRIGKLTVELQSLGYEQLNQIWAFVGGRQLPSAVYKVRMVVLQEEAEVTIQPPITTIKTDLRSR
jgi:hypothetical protein